METPPSSPFAAPGQGPAGCRLAREGGLCGAVGTSPSQPAVSTSPARYSSQETAAPRRGQRDQASSWLCKSKRVPSSPLTPLKEEVRSRTRKPGLISGLYRRLGGTGGTCPHPRESCGVQAGPVSGHGALWSSRWDQDVALRPPGWGQHHPTFLCAGGLPWSGSVDGAESRAGALRGSRRHRGRGKTRGEL